MKWFEPRASRKQTSSGLHHRHTTPPGHSVPEHHGRHCDRASEGSGWRRPLHFEEVIRHSELAEFLLVVDVRLPWIKQANIEVHEVLHVPSHEDQLVLDCYRCDLGIGCSRRAASTVAVSHEASPGPRPWGHQRPNTRPSNCRAKSCSIHLSYSSRRGCSLIFRAPRTSSPMVCAARKRSVGTWLSIQSSTFLSGLGLTVSLTTLVSRRKGISQV